MTVKDLRKIFETFVNLKKIYVFRQFLVCFLKLKKTLKLSFALQNVILQLVWNRTGEVNMFGKCNVFLFPISGLVSSQEKTRLSLKLIIPLELHFCHAVQSKQLLGFFCLKPKLIQSETIKLVLDWSLGKILRL